MESEKEEEQENESEYFQRESMVTNVDSNNNERKHINRKKNTINDKKSKSQQPAPKKGKKETKKICKSL